MTTSRHDTEQPGHEVAVAHHAADDPGGDHGQDDAHDDTDPLGPIDIYAWGAGALGVVLGLAVGWAFASSTGML